MRNFHTPDKGLSLRVHPVHPAISMTWLVTGKFTSARTAENTFPKISRNFLNKFHKENIYIYKSKNKTYSNYSITDIDD